MSQYLFHGSTDPYASGGGASPDPPPIGNPSWTWDVEMGQFPVGSWMYARSSLNSFFCLGNVGAFGGDIVGGVLSGIVEYRTWSNGAPDVVHPVGSWNNNGLADSAFDHNIDSVTFGWEVYGSGRAEGGVNMEVWVWVED